MNTTTPHRSPAYNPPGRAGCFVTFRACGPWLRGDARGSVERRACTLPGMPLVQPDPVLVRCKRDRMNRPPVTLTWPQRTMIEATIREVCGCKEWLLDAVNVRTLHVHVVVTACTPPEPAMNRMKSWCTRRMRENGLWDNERSPWSRHGSTRYMWDKRDVHAVCGYVVFGQDRAWCEVGVAVMMVYAAFVRRGLAW